MAKISEELLEEIFELKKQGNSVRDIAYMVGRSYYSVKMILIKYPPYIEWSKEQRKIRQKQRGDILEMHDSGMSNMEISKKIGMDKQVVSNTIFRELRKRAKENGEDVILAPWQSRSLIFIDDVEYFRQVVQVGDELVYTETEYGIPLMCRVIKKYPYIAMTDAGAVDWPWLTLKNRRLIGK